MRLLLLGGTQFVGRTIAEAAVSRGFEVTTFNRGLSGADVAGVVPVVGDRYDDESVRALASVGRHPCQAAGTMGCAPGFTVPDNMTDFSSARHCAAALAAAQLVAHRRERPVAGLMLTWAG